MFKKIYIDISNGKQPEHDIYVYFVSVILW